MSVIPCTDDVNVVCKTKTEFKKASHQQDNPKSDICSPFFPCSCCVGFTISDSPSSSPVISFTVNKLKGVFLPSEAVDISLPVWQPPQLI